AGVLAEHRALRRPVEVWLQADHTVAPGEPKQLVHGLEQVLKRNPLERRALERLNDAFDQIDQNLLGGHDDHRAQRRAADRQELGGMNQRADVPSGEAETAEHAAKDDDAANDNQHEPSLGLPSIIGLPATPRAVMPRLSS